VSLELVGTENVFFDLCKLRHEEFPLNFEWLSGVISFKFKVLVSSH
jgi:hypothetical protein